MRSRQVDFPFRFCMVGDRPVNVLKWKEDHPGLPDIECNATALEAMYCNNVTGKCDSYFEQARNHSRIRLEDAIKGLMSGVATSKTRFIIHHPPMINL